jgi:hypothetical protein
MLCLMSDDVVRKPHILTCRPVTDTETKLTSIKQASDYFQNTFSNSFPVVDKRLIRLLFREFCVLIRFRCGSGIA